MESEGFSPTPPCFREGETASSGRWRSLGPALRRAPPEGAGEPLLGRAVPLPWLRGGRWAAEGGGGAGLCGRVERGPRCPILGPRGRAGPSASPRARVPRGRLCGPGTPALAGGSGRSRFGGAGPLWCSAAGSGFSRRMANGGDCCSSGGSCNPDVVCEKYVFKSKQSESLVQLACSHHHCAFPLNRNELCIWNAATAQVKPEYISS